MLIGAGCREQIVHPSLAPSLTVHSGPCNSLNCLGHFKNFDDDDDDDDDKDVYIQAGGIVCMHGRRTYLEYGEDDLRFAGLHGHRRDGRCRRQRFPDVREPDVHGDFADTGLTVLDPAVDDRRSVHHRPVDGDRSRSLTHRLPVPPRRSAAYDDALPVARGRERHCFRFRFRGDVEITCVSVEPVRRSRRCFCASWNETAPPRRALRRTAVLPRPSGWTRLLQPATLTARPPLCYRTFPTTKLYI